MTLKLAVILIGVACMLGAASSRGQSSKMIGSWKVEITFESGEHRSVRFECQESGKGSFVPLDPGLKYWGSAAPAEAKWVEGDEGSVTFSGPVQFPLGNVGIDRGTLLLKGKVGANGEITGEAKFFPVGQDPGDPKSKPSKSGAFKATRDTGEHRKPPPT